MIEEEPKEEATEHLVFQEAGGDETPDEALDGDQPQEGEDDTSQAEAAPETPAERIEALESELATQKDQVLRQLAETENVRRRAQREREDTIRYGASALAKDLLNVADNLQRALQAVPTEARESDEVIKNLVIGIELTEKELLSALQKQGVEKIEPLGEKFSYERHQAMFEVPNTGAPAGTVVELMQPGYIMHERLLRPAMVGVAKGDPEAPPEDVDHIDTTA